MGVLDTAFEAFAQSPNATLGVKAALTSTSEPDAASVAFGTQLGATYTPASETHGKFGEPIFNAASIAFDMKITYQTTGSDVGKYVKVRIVQNVDPDPPYTLEADFPWTEFSSEAKTDAVSDVVYASQGTHLVTLVLAGYISNTPK